MSERDLMVQRRLSGAVDDMTIDVERRLSDLRAGRGPTPRRHRVATAVLALIVAVAGLAVVGRAFIRSSSLVGSGSPAHPILFTRWELTPEEPGFPNPRIWSVGVDGTSAGPLPQPAGSNQSAVWSPDDTQIAFVGREGTDAHSSMLYVMNADGSDLTQLADGFGADQPAWSPDGKEIAFLGTKDPESNPTGPRGIWTVPAAGGDPTLVLEGGWEQPAWSPDGTRLVIVGWNSDVRNLYTVNSDGSQLTQITNDGAGYANPQWSPDGTRIVCARWADPSGWNVDVYVMNPDGSHMQQLTDWKGWDSDPFWSPDGGQILFTSDRDATPAELSIDERQSAGERGLALYVMNADGSDVRSLFDDGAMQSVPTSWGP
jgi:Tol biopolymer transport system component